MSAGATSDGTLVALGGDFVNAIGFSGWSATTEGPMKMLYACENVRTTQYPAKLNLPPMAAFRAPGFVEGTFALECLLDELAAKLGIDPLELRRRNYADSDRTDDRPFSSKNLAECYRRAEPHWAKRDEVRARSQGPWKHGIGLASQIWYGGGGPPSYAWIRVGSDGHAQVVTAMQDIGTGTRTAMAQIAAEELGIPLDHVQVSLGDSARGPFASISAGSSTVPSMGPAVRSAAGDAKRQIIEIAAQRFHLEERVLDIRDGQIVSADGGSWPLTEVTGLLESGQILGKGARGPNPAGMQVLTFGVQVAEIAVDVETGEVRVDKIVAIHDVGRVINALGAESQVEGGIIQGIGHTLSEERIVDPSTGSILTRTLDAYRMPTIADVPEIVTDLVDVPDPHLTNLGSKGLGEPPIIPSRPRSRTRFEMRPERRFARCRSPAKRCCARCARRRHARRSAVELLRPSSTEEATRALGNGSRALAGGTELVPLMRDGLVRADTLVHISDVVPRGSTEPASAQARHWPSSRSIRRSRRRCAKHARRRLRRSCARWERSAAISCRRHAAGTGGWASTAGCTAASSALRKTARTASTRSSATSSARPLTRRTSQRRCSRSAPPCTRRSATFRSRSSTGCRPTTTATSRRSHPMS